MNKIKFASNAIVAITLLAMLGCGSVQHKMNTTEQDPSLKVDKVLDTDIKGLRRVVAIGRFTDETKNSNSFLLDKNDNKIGKQASDILSARLVATNKFIMLERSDISLLENDNSNISEMKIPADYLIVGSISEFGRKNESDVGFFTRSKKQVATATVNVRLIDTKTGQIIYSEEGSGEALSTADTTLGMGGRAGYDSSLNDKAISVAISKLVNNLVKNLTDKPWRAFFIGTQENYFIVSGGMSQGLEIGTILDVFEAGKLVKNPQSGMMIELPGKKVAQIKVVQLLGSGSNEISLAEIDSGKINKNKIAAYYLQEK